MKSHAWKVAAVGLAICGTVLAQDAPLAAPVETKVSADKAAWLAESADRIGKR